MTRRTSILAIFAATLFTLSLSSSASAQSNDPWWGRNRNGGYNGRYDTRALRDVAQRIKDRSHNLESDVNRALDRSRINGSRREDYINADVKDFRRAADRFKDRVGNGNDPNRASAEAQELLGLAGRIDNELARLRLDSRSYSDWSEIRQDLRVVSDFYGYGNGGYYPNNGRYPNDRRTNDSWWRRLPDIMNGRRP